MYYSRVFHDRVLGRMFELTRDEVTGDWRKVHEGLHCLYTSPNIVRTMKGSGHVKRMGEFLRNFDW
jgi:truncated hemoglobin YjbI